MKPPIQEILNLDEAANILRCEIEDILENWSLGKIYLCINIVPPQKVIVIDDAYIQYLDDRGMDFVDVENIPEPEDCNLRFEEISGPFYLMPETQKNQARPFVKEPNRFHATGLNTLKAKILIPPQKFDELIKNHITELLDYRRGSFHFIYDYEAGYMIQGYGYKTKHLRITKNELNRFSEINSININNTDSDKDLLAGERDSLLLTIGALADLVASEHGAAFMTGEKPNKSRITDTLMEHVGKNIHGLRSSSIQERISKGLKLLDKAKKES